MRFVTGDIWFTNTEEATVVIVEVRETEVDYLITRERVIFTLNKELFCKYHTRMK